MILELLFKQKKHALQRLGVWYLIQAVIIWGFILATASYYVASLIKRWPKSLFVLSLLVAVSLMIYLFVLALFFLLYRLQKQLPLTILRSLPWSKRHLGQLFFYYLQSSWRWGWLLTVTFFMSLLRINLEVAVLFFLIFLFNAVTAAIFSISCFLRYGRTKYFVFLMTLILIILLFFGFFLWTAGQGLSFAIIIFDLFLLLAAFIFYRNSQPLLEQIYSLNIKEFSSQQSKSIKAGMNGLFRQLVKRNFWANWRLPFFRKRKALLPGIILGGGYLIFLTFPGKAVGLFTLLVFLLIWWHYGQFFNPEFGLREPEWFFRGNVLPFFKYFTAKFLAEFWFVLLILFFYSLTLYLEQIPLAEHWQLLLALALAAITILTVMISFQIIFFDDVSTAGFAFYFSNLFFLILTLWDHFVGPIITLLFLSFYLWKSYSFMRS